MPTLRADARRPDQYAQAGRQLLGCERGGHRGLDLFAGEQRGHAGGVDMSTLWWVSSSRREEPSPPRTKVVICRTNRLGAGNEKRAMSAQSSWTRAAGGASQARGHPQIIDVANETHPKIIAKLMLQVSDPAKCQQQVNQTPPVFCPGADGCPGTNLPPESGSINYSEERCVADNPMNATMLACSFQNAGLRVFDISDPYHPTEVAYYRPGAVRTAFRPSSGSWAPGVDRTVDKVAASQQTAENPRMHDWSAQTR